VTFSHALLIASVFMGFIALAVSSLIGVLKLTDMLFDSECALFITAFAWFTFLFALLVYLGENCK